MVKRNWMIPICVMLPQNEVEAIDKERDGTPRSIYLRDIILKRKR